MNTTQNVTIGYEIDHAGPRDFRVNAILESGGRSWCQSYLTRREAEAGKRACEAENPPHNTPRSLALREAATEVWRAVRALERASERLILAAPEAYIAADVDALLKKAESMHYMMRDALGEP